MEALSHPAPDWQQLELLVAAIQRQLAPNAKVTHNAKLPGLLSETTRQVDVLVEQSIGQYSMRIAIDCKDYGVPVDVKGVEEFDGLVKDIGAQKGALVCPSGFTRSAKKRARKLDIDLYSPADTGAHKWQVRLALPVVCDFRATRIGFGISCSAPVPFRVPQKFFTLPAFSNDDQNLGVIYDIATQRWNEGEYPFQPGAHEGVSLIPDVVTKIDNGYGTLAPVSLSVNLLVTSQRYYGHVPVEQLSGLRDEQTGLVITNAFTVGALDPIMVQNEWKKLGENEEPPLKPVFTVLGLHSWGPMDE
jgi:hypothetical protein